MSKNESVTDDTTTLPGSPSSPERGSRIEIAGDEDWKSRVKAEDAALDQQFRAEPPKTTGQPADEAKPESAATAGRSASSASDAPSTPSSAAPDRPAETAREMPNPIFADLVALLSTQAMMFLGLIPNPATQKAETQLSTARYFIDLISILEEKTAGQLTKEEATILGDTLHSLRMTFMQCSKQTGSKQTGSKQSD